MPGNNGRGRMQHLVYAYCGKCDFSYGYGDANDAKGSGWRYTKRYGWICPDCVAKNRNPKSKE